MKKNIKEDVKKNYTEIVKNNTGCGPSCCDPEQEVTFLDENYKNIDGYEEVADFGLGCGLPTEIADIKKGNTVLDLGSGAGNDVFIARRQTGENGKVIGIDFTEAMIEKANENKQKLGFQNVEFLLGDIEELPVPDSSIDVVISNCVMNLVPDKNKAYKEVYRVLKSNGHFSISDVVLNGNLPKGILNATEMYAACVSGALKKNDYLEVIKDSGFENIEVLKQHEIFLPDELLLQFISNDELQTYRSNQSAILSITINGTKPLKK
ncbi:MAG: arsenite methyltransferase [Candidatus Cloacimonetes bacterium]|nr:arsenite methyltransferase [Candidatus Cloacimonadota bacterium]